MVLVFVFPKKSMLKFYPAVWTEWWLSHEGRIFMSSISSLTKEAQERLLTCSLQHTRTSQKGVIYEPGNGPHQILNPTSTLVLGLPVSRTMRNKFLFFVSYVTCGIISNPNRLRHYSIKPFVFLLCGTENIFKWYFWLDVVAEAYNPSFLWGRRWRGLWFEASPGKKFGNPISINGWAW
jgi:hypothetical protein